MSQVCKVCEQVHQELTSAVLCMWGIPTVDKSGLQFVHGYCGYS